MIIIYPMLTSSNVSPNIIPAICKTLEKFVILYGIDEVLKTIKKRLGVKIIKAGAKLLIKELNDTNLPAISGGSARKKEPSNLTDPFSPGGGKPGAGIGSGPTGVKSVDQMAARARDAAEELLKTDTSGGGAGKVYIPDHDSLSLEPSYVQIETSSGPRILGIKVLPFPVKGNISMAKLMADDTKRKAMDYMVTKYSRKVSRLFYRLCRSLKVPVIKNQALTGDPQKDILFATTKYGIHTFPLFNFMDLSENKIYKDPKIVQKLQKMSWGSYIIADDVNKRAIFCMKEFGGLCSTVLYSYMLASFKKGNYYDVYTDLEDIKRSSGTFFSMKVHPKRLIGESRANNKKEIYTNIKEEIVKENFESSLKSLSKNDAFKKVFLNIEKMSKAKDENIDKIKKVFKNVPKVPFSKVESFCKKICSNFDNSYNLSQKVIANSTSLPIKLIKPISCIVAIFSSYKNENYKQDTKTNLQNVVNEIRKIKKPVQKESENLQEGIVGYLFKDIIELFLQVIKTLFSSKAAAEIQFKMLTFSFAGLWAAVPMTPVIIIVSIISLIILAYLIETS